MQAYCTYSSTHPPPSARDCEQLISSWPVERTSYGWKVWWMEQCSVTTARAAVTTKPAVHLRHGCSCPRSAVVARTQQKYARISVTIDRQRGSTPHTLPCHPPSHSYAHNNPPITHTANQPQSIKHATHQEMCSYREKNKLHDTLLLTHNASTIEPSVLEATQRSSQPLLTASRPRVLRSSTPRWYCQHQSHACYTS